MRSHISIGTSWEGGKRPDQALNKNTAVGKGASDPNTNQNQQGPERAPAGSRTPTCQTLISDQDRREIEGLEPAGARSGPCWFWSVFGSLAPFLTAVFLFRACSILVRVNTCIVITFEWKLINPTENAL